MWLLANYLFDNLESVEINLLSIIFQRRLFHKNILRMNGNHRHCIFYSHRKS